MADDEMVKGFFLKTPKDTAPDFVLRKVSVNVDQFVEYLRNNANEAGYVNFDLNEAKSKHWYLKLDTWQPNPDYQPNDSGSQDVNQYREDKKDKPFNPADYVTPAGGAGIDDSDIPF